MEEIVLKKGNRETSVPRSVFRKAIIEARKRRAEEEGVPYVPREKRFKVKWINGGRKLPY